MGDHRPFLLKTERLRRDSVTVLEWRKIKRNQLHPINYSFARLLSLLPRFGICAIMEGIRRNQLQPGEYYRCARLLSLLPMVIGLLFPKSGLK